MPKYAYHCGADGIFEEWAGHNDSAMPCPVCHQPARRRPFSGVPNLKGETVARSIPDPMYRHEAQKRELNRTWGDASRSVEMMRKNTVTGPNGERSIDLKGMNA